MFISLSGSNLQATGASQHESFSNIPPPAIAASKLANIITHITKSSLPSSIPTYTRAWKLFTQFHSTILQTACFSLLIFPATLALFIAYLFDRNYAPSTVNTYVSDLGYSHKLSDLPNPTRVEVVGRTGFRLDGRLPITLPILKRLLDVPIGILCILEDWRAHDNTGCQPLQMHQLANVYDSSNHVVGMKLTSLDF